MSNYSLYRTTAELPLGRWIKLNDNKDLRQLIISGEPTAQELVEAWYELNDEYIEKHGNKSDLQQAQKDKVRAVKMLCKYIKTRDRFIEFEAKILLDEINEDSETQGVTVMEEKGYIEETIGFFIPETVTVDEYEAKKKQAHKKWRIQSKANRSLRT